MNKIHVVLDGFGGDNSPLEILKGARLAADELNVNVTVTGDENKLKEVCAKNNINTSNLQFLHAASIMPVHANPTDLLKKYRSSSMGVAFDFLASGNADVFVSAGSTGAVVVGGTLIVKRIKGIKRPAIGTVIPNIARNYFLVDMGANSECRPEMLVQFGIMGSIYMKELIGVKNPKVGLVNIGAEETKGLQLQLDAYELMKSAPINFIGNVEGRDLPLGMCDVAVCDGFCGNVILKVTEGMGKLMSVEMKNLFFKNAKSKLAALLLKKDLMAFKQKFDYAEEGGAPLMGVQSPVIKAHGNSDARAIKNAVRQAKKYHENNVINLIEKALEKNK